MREQYGARPSVDLRDPAGVTVIHVESARDMLHKVEAALPADIAIFAAAVADYRPTQRHDEKIKKNDASLAIEFERTPDILASLANDKGQKIIVGFAAETERVAENARKKLVSKSADLIVANDVTAEGAGFDRDTNIVTLFSRDARDLALPKLSKSEVAQRILDEYLEPIHHNPESLLDRLVEVLEKPSVLVAVHRLRCGVGQ